MMLSDMQRKDIVNMNDGTRLGRIIDIELDEKGYINNLIIERNKTFKNLLSTDRDIKVSFDKIKKMGEDVILVDIT